MKEYTVNAIINGNAKLKDAFGRLRDLNISRKNIDYISHLDSREKSVRISKYHKGHYCAFYGYILGALIGAFILLLTQIESSFILAQFPFQVALESLWVHMVSGGAVGALAGLLIGSRLVQYVIRYDKVESAPQFRHLLMVEVTESKKEKVSEALEPLSESVDILDNHTEIELGLRPKEAN